MLNKSDIQSMIEKTCDEFEIKYPDKVTYKSGLKNGWCRWHKDGTKEIELPSDFINSSKYNRILMKWVVLHEVTHLQIIDQKHGSEFKKLEAEILEFNGIKAEFENSSDQYPSRLYAKLKSGDYMFVWRKKDGEDVSGKEWDHLYKETIEYKQFFS